MRKSCQRTLQTRDKAAPPETRSYKTRSLGLVWAVHCQSAPAVVIADFAGGMSTAVITLFATQMVAIIVTRFTTNVIAMIVARFTANMIAMIITGLTANVIAMVITPFSMVAAASGV